MNFRHLLSYDTIDPVLMPKSQRRVENLKGLNLGPKRGLS